MCSDRQPLRHSASLSPLEGKHSTRQTVKAFPNAEDSLLLGKCHIHVTYLTGG
jgi:hypothetical protein